jgi:copper(I)-binding protein
VGLGSGAAAQEKPVTASDAWVMLPAAGQTDARAFAVVDNPTMYDIYLVSATADAAEKVVFRDASKPGDAAAQDVKEVTVASYSKVGMDPKGVQMVLTGLKRPLKEGETVAITITTDGGAKLQLSASVKK